MIYLDNAATTYPKPSEVYDVLDNANRNLAFNAGRGHYPKADEAFSLIESTRRFLCNKAASKNLVFTPSATHALNQIISGIEYLKDDVVYYSPYDHNAIVRTLYAYSKKIGFQLKKIPLKKDNSIDLEKLNFDILLDKPKALFCTHVSNVTGYILPIEKIGKITRENGVLFIVDGAQAFGLIPVDVTAMNIDYYVFAGHKTLYGPFGIAGYFSNTNKLKMSFFGGTGTDSLNIEMPKDEIVKFEPSSPNIVAIAGLQTAAKWIFEKDLYNHEKGLFDYAYEKLSLLDDVVIYNDPNLPNTGMISFNLKGYKSEDVSDILAKDFDICTRGGYHCCPFIHDVLDTKKYLGTVRISFSYFTTKNDIDYLIEALEEILYES